MEQQKTLSFAKQHSSEQLMRVIKLPTPHHLDILNICMLCLSLSPCKFSHRQDRLVHCTRLTRVTPTHSTLQVAELTGNQYSLTLSSLVFFVQLITNALIITQISLLDILVYFTLLYLFIYFFFSLRHFFFSVLIMSSPTESIPALFRSLVSAIHQNKALEFARYAQLGSINAEVRIQIK